MPRRSGSRFPPQQRGCGRGQSQNWCGRARIWQTSALGSLWTSSQPAVLGKLLRFHVGTHLREGIWEDCPCSSCCCTKRPQTFEKRVPSIPISQRAAASWDQHKTYTLDVITYLSLHFLCPFIYLFIFLFSVTRLWAGPELRGSRSAAALYLAGTRCDPRDQEHRLLQPNTPTNQFLLPAWPAKNSTNPAYSTRAPKHHPGPTFASWQACGEAKAPTKRVPLKEGPQQRGNSSSLPPGAVCTQGGCTNSWCGGVRAHPVASGSPGTPGGRGG